MNTFYRILSFDGLELTDSGNIVQSNLDSSLPKNKTVAIPEPFTFTELHTSKTIQGEGGFYN